MTIANLQELGVHYALACRGNRELAFLLLLDADYDFATVVGAMGDDGLRVAFECLLKGWIEYGKITDAGRMQLQKAADA